jgi:hypothetical protein
MGRDHQPRGPYKNNKHHTREEILRYLRENHIRSQKHLCSIRKPGDPTVWSVLHEFGKWSEARRIANYEPKIVFDKSYLIKAVCEFGLWTERKFAAAHKKNPKIIPSEIMFIKFFGSFSGLFGEAKKENIKRLLWEYLRLERRIRHIPLMSDVKKRGLDIDTAIKFYGSKRELDEFLFGKERVKNERKRRGS